MKVNDYMGGAISVDSASTAVEASQMMMKHYRSSVLVENNRTVIGIITRSDFMRVVTKERVSPTEIKVYQMMSSPLITIDSNSTVSEAARIMCEKKIQNLPVLDSERYVGILSAPDIIRATVGANPVFETRSEKPIGSRDDRREVLHLQTPNS